MINLNSTRDLRFLLPETVWLEAEHFSKANQTSSLETANADNAWQVYLNTLALQALEVWLDDRLNLSAGDTPKIERVLNRDTSTLAIAGSLKIGDYKFCALAAEHLLDEIVCIPERVLEQPEFSCHFFVLLEVLEEEEEVIIRGFLPYKQLIQIQNKLPVNNSCYQIPFSDFDIELNHLLTYYRYIPASEFVVPQTAQVFEGQVSPVNHVSRIGENIVELVSSSTTKLSKWLQGVVDEGWQTIESLANPELSLAFSTRSFERDTRRAKVIDLGVDLGGKKFALLLNVFAAMQENTLAEISDTIKVLVQLYPLDGENFLPPNTKILLLSKAGKTLQEVTARNRDNYIQLKQFKGEPGKKFSIQISLGDVNLKEDFEL